MNTTVKSILLIICGLLISILGGTAWWVLWMNHGWPGPPGILADLLKADGEGAYDATQTEMILVIGFVLCSIWIIFRMRRAKA